jgi:hypothetical protein
VSDVQQTSTEGNFPSEKGRRRPVESQFYQIRVKGHLDSSWSERLDGLTITHEEDGTTLLAGPVADQPALHGLLIRIRDLGLPLLSVNALGSDEVGRVKPDQGEALGQLNQSG